MKRYPLLLISLVIATAFLSLAIVYDRAEADTRIPIKDLIENMKKYDGQTVTIGGEAIGDLMVRGTHTWFTVDDDPYSNKSIEAGGQLVGMSNMSMSVWAEKIDSEDIKILGGYKNKGDRVMVTGVFNRACHEHGGDTDIHAFSVEVIRPGHPFSHHFQYGKLLAVLILGALIIFLWDLRRSRIKKAIRGG
ncbi:MAG: hypothetical protein MUP40_00770 [Actinobacteria bacterium]|nr:hypothetical protein [Actinomycetota bacterium]